ncbi:hypothetical protein EG14_03880 [Porphyromonas gingivalis]|nr:hypothetical protein EG14_03880 [Porphyromonas gingivalis]
MRPCSYPFDRLFVCLPVGLLERLAVGTAKQADTGLHSLLFTGSDSYMTGCPDVPIFRKINRSFALNGLFFRRWKQVAPIRHREAYPAI